MFVGVSAVFDNFIEHFRQVLGGGVSLFEAFLVSTSVQ